jgi:uncharacterized protein YndB with AHSA1/START domain
MQECGARGRTDTASRIVAADPDAVYAAFATAASLMAWLPPGGMSGRALEYDFREGGRYRLELTYDAAARAGDGKTTARSDVSAGRFLTLEPGRRIVWTVEFESNDSAFGGQMLMTWSFAAVPDGTCVTITAENVPPGVSKTDHDEGLRASLENLAAHVRTD